MKASEIVSKLKEVLLSSTEDVETQDTIQEEVQLEESTPEVKEEVQLEETPEGEVSEDDLAEEPAEMSYATKEELAEVRALVEKMMGQLEAKEESKVDVPQELSADEAPEQPLMHSPENVSENAPLNLYAQNRATTTLDRVLQRISK
jgi:hypothetical protein